MDENFYYETFLLISSQKFVVSVNSSNKEKIYEKEFLVENDFPEIDFQKLDFFLNENIFKIERDTKNFVKRTSIILDLDLFFPIDIGIRKKNYENDINLKNLSHVLYEARDCCRKTMEEKKIAHVIIQNYKFD